MKNLIKKYTEQKQYYLINSFETKNSSSYATYKEGLKVTEQILTDLQALEKQYGDMERLLIENEKMGAYIKALEKRHDEDMIEFAYYYSNVFQQFTNNDTLAILQQFKEQQDEPK